MPASANGNRQKFYVDLINPSHYDDDGYVIQWWKAWIPSNSLACLYGLTLDVAERRVLGDDVDLVVHAYDETNTTIPTKKIVRRIKHSGRGLVCMVGVQSNQFPRAIDIARQFRNEGIQVAIGGFHVSGCIAMLPEMPDDLREALDLGISLFAGEAEGRLGDIFADAYHGRMKPMYNFMHDLPHLEEQPVPFLPKAMVRKYAGAVSSFDAGRGCPFQCSFCTIINVQGRKSRYRNADDVERLVRTNVTQGITRFFITDDNFARNKNWESIFDRLAELKERENLPLSLIIQVDTLCHKIPNFVEKAKRAGVSRVFIGLENINPDNLMAAKKHQNRITEYRKMLQAWRNQRIITYAGYILGFPNDTPESIEEDIKIIKRELPVDFLEFFCLTPLPGSEDHQKLYMQGVWMDPDMNIYDTEHVTTVHERMSKEEWQGIYRRAWDIYYSFDHIETLMRRAVATGNRPNRILSHTLQFHGSIKYENVHPLQGGYFRRKVRTQRRSGIPRENPLVFYPRRVWQMFSTYVPYGLYAWKLWRLCRKVKLDPASKTYIDLALIPVVEAEEERLEMYEQTEAARAAVAKAKAKAAARKLAPVPATPSAS